MIIAYGMFIFGLIGFFGSVSDAGKMVHKYGHEIDIPINKRIFFHTLILCEVTIILCSAQYIWG